MTALQKIKGETIWKSGAFACALACIVLLAYACSKDDEGPEPPTPPTATCDVPDHLYHGAFNSIVDTLSIGPACVNPNDPDDIIFYRQATFTLYRYHRISGQLNVLREPVAVPVALKWSGDDMLLMASGQGVNTSMHIYTSLAEGLLLQWPGATWPAWGPSHDYMAYNARSSSMAEWFTYTGASTDTEDRDTLATYLHGDRAWVSPDTLFHGGQVYHIGSDQLVDLVETFGVHYTTAVDQTHFYTADRNTLYALDAATSTYEVIQEWTNCEGFTHIQYHAGMDKLFATRVHRQTFAATNALIELRSLVWLNLDGTVYEEVDLVDLFYPE